MLKIFRGSEPAVVFEWKDKFSGSQPPKELSVDRMIAFLEVFESKAQSAGDAAKLEDARVRLAEIHMERGNYQQAGDYFGMLRESVDKPEQKREILAELLRVNLHLPDLKAARNLLSNSLLEGDLGEDSEMVKVIEEFLGRGKPVGPQKLVGVLKEIDFPDKGRTKWQQQLEKWSLKYAKANEPAPEKKNK
jgi:hypothetical protein